jgi:hypothetical protein
MKIDPFVPAEGWRGSVSLRGAEVAFTIDAECWDLDPTVVIASAIHQIDARWREIEDALVKQSLRLYHDSWIDPEVGRQRIDVGEFLDRVSVADIAVGIGSIDVRFDDGGLFAGHSISVLLISGQPPTVTLEG